ncbi:hypothetical protein Gpo141_00011721 [Globisporangium polare]
MKSSLYAAAALATLTAAPLQQLVQAGEQLCSLPPITYAGAKAAHPESAFALEELESHGIATWYSDREENGDYVATARELVAHCPESSRLSVVVYGLPNKDCEAGYSTAGSRVHSAADYEQFIGTLAGIIGQRKVLFVLEPDAVGLLVQSGGSGCAAKSGYKENLKTAIRILTSANPSADVYLDVGYWTLGDSDSTWKVTDVVRELGAAGRVKGITLNTSNYRSNSELAGLCGNFQRAAGYNGMNCIIDTSRNYRALSTSEWCNVKTAGIGKVPTSDTGFSNIDYFVWIKPPGDSDGTCSDGSHTWEAMQGPDAGVFFQESFEVLWNQGSLVQELGLSKVDGTIRSVPSTEPPTPTTTPAPVPVTVTPEPAPATPEPTVDNLAALRAAVAAQLLDAALKAMHNETVAGEADSASSSASGAGSFRQDVGGNSSSAGAVVPTVEVNTPTPVAAPSSSPSPAPEEQVRGISTTSAGMSSGAKAGVITALFFAGLATAVGVAIFFRSQRSKLEQNKAMRSSSGMPLTPP